MKYCENKILHFSKYIFVIKPFQIFPLGFRTNVTHPKSQRSKSAKSHTLIAESTGPQLAPAVKKKPVTIWHL